MEQLTHDHSRVAEMVRDNLITEEDAATHPYRNVLSRALGTHPHVEVDVEGPLSVHVGDTYVLCSDGLNYLSDHEIQATVQGLDPQAACDRLIQQANATGGLDNTTVQIIHIHDLAPANGHGLFMRWKKVFKPEDER